MPVLLLLRNTISQQVLGGDPKKPGAWSVTGYYDIKAIFKVGSNDFLSKVQETMQSIYKPQ